MSDMPEDEAEQLLWGKAVASLRSSLDLTQPQLADRLDWTVQNLGLYERGKRQGILRRAIRKKITDAMGVSPEELDLARANLPGGSPARQPATELASGGRTFLHPAPSGQLLPIRDRAQAGAWLAADDFIQDYPRRYPAAKDPRYLHADQWLTEVVGDSVDQLRIFNGDFVHCVEMAGIGRPVATGDIVEVERFRAGGHERELTLKQAEVTGGGIILWPRSSNRRWTEPLELRHGLAENEEAEIRVRGLVLHVIRQLS
ncbi:MAG: helix-turn-helix transcriptional regulator [Caulobacter sp.]|nr:helix-turn-helix transcriptional regulator [Caulobacter sp.]